MNRFCDSLTKSCPMHVCQTQISFQTLRVFPLQKCINGKVPGLSQPVRAQGGANNVCSVTCSRCCSHCTDFQPFNPPKLTSHVCVPAHICLPIRFTFPWTSHTIISQVLSKNVFIFHWEPGQCCSVRIKKRIKGFGNRRWTCLCMCVGYLAFGHGYKLPLLMPTCWHVGTGRQTLRHRHKPCTVLS